MKMLDIKRTIEEVIAIYSIEENIIDTYVEGVTDKLIIENYYEYKGCNKSIIEIDDIDFSEIRNKYSDLDLKSNKDKLIALSRLLVDSNVNSDIKCVIDRDFDGILTPMHTDKHLFYTDFSCMESYILCKENINKILKIGIKNFPYETELVINEIKKVIFILFLMRLINKNFGFNFVFPKIENNININKNSGECIIDFFEYLNKYINVNKLINQKAEILEFAIENYEKFKNGDIRFYMNGHDFIEVLFLYINKIKNTANFKLDNFERAIYLSVQPNYLDKYALFGQLAS